MELWTYLLQRMVRLEQQLEQELVKASEEEESPLRQVLSPERQAVLDEQLDTLIGAVGHQLQPILAQVVTLATEPEQKTS